MRLRHLLLSLAALSSLIPAAFPAAFAAESAAVRSPRAIATLISDADTVQPGGQFRVGLRLRLAPGWHTYWRNPGDAGAPPEIALTLPEGSHAGDIQWPVPERLPEGQLMTFGYSGEVVLPITITQGATIGPITATASWLVCKDICIPEQGTFRLDLPAGPPASSLQAPFLAAADRARPRPLPWPARIAPDGTLSVRADELSPANVTDAWFFPDTPGAIDHAAPQPMTVSATGLQLTLKPGAEFRPDVPLAGVLVVADAGGQRSAFSLSAPPGPAEAPGMPPGPAEAPGMPLGLPFGQALVFAFLGGLILNLMPCVFPVLAMKAVGLAAMSGQERAHARLGAAFYTLGVLVTFAALGGALVAARAAGTAAGWGFQFQSPVFVAGMAWVMFAIGLNLSGVYQVGGQLGGRAAGIGQGAASRGGLAGYFATGLLAAVVATPCTAPFMGAAIGAALAASPPVTAAIFLALGLGLAAPYVLLALVPELIRLLPRPGAWMEVLKQALAFPMYAAAAWLVWVLAQAQGPAGVLAGGAGLVLLGFAAWAEGSAQRAMRPGPRRAGRLAAALALAGMLALLPGLAAPGPSGPAASLEAGTEAFSAAHLATLRAEGRPVFVNMTAAWCITCLVNERVALSPAAVRAEFRARGITYMKGDWTRQDPEITAFLRQHGRDGVPLYVLYPARGAPDVLPQILTEGTVLAALARAGG